MRVYICVIMMLSGSRATTMPIIVMLRPIIVMLSVIAASGTHHGGEGVLPLPPRRVRRVVVVHRARLLSGVVPPRLAPQAAHIAYRHAERVDAQVVEPPGVVACDGRAFEMREALLHLCCGRRCTSPAASELLQRALRGIGRSSFAGVSTTASRSSSSRRQRRSAAATSCIVVCYCLWHCCCSHLASVPANDDCSCTCGRGCRSRSAAVEGCEKLRNVIAACDSSGQRSRSGPTARFEIPKANRNKPSKTSPNSCRRRLASSTHAVSGR